MLHVWQEVPHRWRFALNGGQEITVRVRSTKVSDDGDVARRWALPDKGIACKAGFEVADDLAQGRLRA